MIVDLRPWEYEHAANVGIRRYVERWESSNAAHYDSARMEDERTAQVAAACCELAVARYVNQYWHGHVWKAEDHHRYKWMADVGHSIEVRRVRTRNAVAVRRHQLGQNLWLWAAKAIEPEFRQVEIVGSLPYDKAWDLGAPSGFNEDTRYVSFEYLDKP